MPCIPMIVVEARGCIQTYSFQLLSFAFPRPPFVLVMFCVHVSCVEMTLPMYLGLYPGPEAVLPDTS